MRCDRDELFKIDSRIVFRSLQSRNQRFGRGLRRTVCKRRKRCIYNIYSRFNCHQIDHIPRTRRIMRMQMKFGFGKKFLFKRSNKLKRFKRQQKICHIFNTNIVRAHIFVSLCKLYEIVERMNGARRIGNRCFTYALSSRTVFFNGAHRRFDIARIV